jgi:xanthine dehydrogenase YagR molybdenum-binding subunit
LAHAVVVQSTIPAGRIAAIDTDAVLRMPGVIAVLSHDNAPRLSPVKRFPLDTAGWLFTFGTAALTLLPLQDDRIRFAGQPVALVVAETFEQATDAANAPPFVVDALYTSPRQCQAMMEPHATVASWDADGMLTVWEPTQWVDGTRAAFADWFQLPRDRVRVISPFVGGAFGAKLLTQAHTPLAAMAARELGRPVKLVLTRPQAFSGISPRPALRQRVALAADAEGRLQALVHDAVNETSVDDVYIEAVCRTSRFTYAVPNLRTTYQVVPVDAVTPTWMRSPGEAMGTFALECAMDELAVAAGLDPLELRLRNYAERDQESGKPWSTRPLREAYAQGAAAFGWEQRDPRPRSMRQGRDLIGWGMAGGSYPSLWKPAQACARLRADGAVEVESDGVDIGTGTYTILAQVAADALGTPVEQVTVRLGDSAYPFSAPAGGSMLTSAIAPVVHGAASGLREALIRLAVDDPGSPLHGIDPVELFTEQGRVVLGRDPRQRVGFADILRRSGHDTLESFHDSTPPGSTGQDLAETVSGDMRIRPPTGGSHSVQAWSAIFAEVRVDEDLGTLRVRRMVGAFDCGRVLNPMTARSQLVGGMIMGMGGACYEGGVVDRRAGRLLNANLAEYLVAVNADIPQIEVIFVGEPDPYANPLGTKPVGELGSPGVSAAIANAVYHATGRRVRDLPILLEKLL